MKIIYRSGAAGAWDQRSGEPHVRFTGEVVDANDSLNIRIDVPDREDAALLMGMFAYMAGLPNFTESEHRLIAEACRAHALAGHALDHALNNIACQIEQAQAYKR